MRYKAEDFEDAMPYLHMISIFVVGLFMSNFYRNL